MGGLDDETMKRICTILASFSEIDKAILYGSRAKGNYKTGSDIDLTLTGTLLTQTTLFKIHDALDELYLPYKFDLSLLDCIDNKDLKMHIRRIGIVFYEKTAISGNA